MMCRRSFQIENKKEKQNDVKYFTKRSVSSVVYCTDVSSVTDGNCKRTYKSVLMDIKSIAFVTVCTYQKFLLHAHFTTCLYILPICFVLISFFPLFWNNVYGCLILSPPPPRRISEYFYGNPHVVFFKTILLRTYFLINY